MGRTLRVWNDDEKNAATVLFYDGVSATDAAAQFSQQQPRQITRNAIIGAWHRLGLNRGHKPAENKKRSASDVKKYGADFNIAKAVNRLRQPPRVTFVDPIVPISDPDMNRAKYACTLFELRNESCRWPHGDPGKPDFFFCGVPEAAFDKSHPYCRAHASIAFNPRVRP